MRGRAVGLVLLALLCLALPGAAEADPEVPEEVYISGVVGHRQIRPLSCEARSAVDLAVFWGVSVAEGDFFAALPRADNPHQGFVGDVDDPPGSLPPGGYGVYAELVAVTLRRYGLDARAHRWLGLLRLKRELAAGRPVVIWATYRMLRPEIGSWTSADGSVSIIVQWEHTFIAVGYDAGGVYLLDAYDGRTHYYPIDRFVPAWMQLNEMAVTVEGPLEGPAYPWWEVKAQGFGRWFLDEQAFFGPH
ncbi:MAG TPA: hypothetical protein EYP77_05360 [Anaerolineae bacterium]|nr:hypothetical protein [Anaerolineae bacterium]